MPGFIRSPRTLAIYDVAHSLPRGGVGRGFPFTEDETRRYFSYLSFLISSSYLLSNMHKLQLSLKITFILIVNNLFSSFLFGTQVSFTYTNVRAAHF